MTGDPPHLHSFTTTEDPNYGPFLVSVNGIAGSQENNTYWELLAESKSGTIIRPDVGESRLPMF